MPGYTLDDGRTLRNLLGIIDSAALAKAEREITEGRLSQILGDIFRANGDGRRVLVGETRELDHKASIGSTFTFTAGTTAERPRGPSLLDAVRGTITGLLRPGDPQG